MKSLNLIRIKQPTDYPTFVQVEILNIEYFGIQGKDALRFQLIPKTPVTGLNKKVILF